MNNGSKRVSESDSLITVLVNIFDQNQDKNGSSIALDVGAHKGLFSKDILNRNLVDKVIAFEPNSETFKKIEIDSDRLITVNAAVGSAEGTLSYKCDDNSPTGSLLEYDSNYQTTGDVREENVPVIKLDEYCSSEEFQNLNVSLIKVDTQGYDLEVIKGAENIITKHSPVVIVELIYYPLYENQANPADIISYLSERGYDLHTIANIHTDPYGKLAFLDAVFVSEKTQTHLKQSFTQIDNQDSLKTQIAILENICKERLDVINVLDREVKRLKTSK